MAVILPERFEWLVTSRLAFLIEKSGRLFDGQHHERVDESRISLSSGRITPNVLVNLCGLTDLINSCTTRLFGQISSWPRSMPLSASPALDSLGC